MREMTTIYQRLHDFLNEGLVDRYGLGYELRRYGLYPIRWPITVTGEHGPSLLSEPIQEAVNKPSPFYFVTASYKSKWKIKNKFVIRHPSPFVWYRRSKVIEARDDASGSLFFYSHSTKQIKSISNKDRFIDNLETVPDVFRPITICFHFNDLNSDFTEKLDQKGYRWITLSRRYEDNQIETFYDVVPNYKFVLANSFTSALLYACELGIPGSIVFHQDVSYTNLGNRQYTSKEWTPMSTANERSRYAIELFGGYNLKVNEEQKKFTHEMLGLDLIDSGKARAKVMFSLYASLISVSIAKFFSFLMKRMKWGNEFKFGNDGQKTV